MKTLSLEAVMQKRKLSKVVTKVNNVDNNEMNRFVNKCFRQINDHTIHELITLAMNNHVFCQEQKLRMIQLIKKKQNIHLNKAIVLPKIEVSYYPKVTLVSHHWQNSNLNYFILKGELRLYQKSDVAPSLAKFNTQPSYYPEFYPQISLPQVQKQQTYQSIQHFIKKKPQLVIFDQFKQFDGVGNIFNKGLSSQKHTKLVAINAVIVKLGEIQAQSLATDDANLSYNQKLQLLSHFPALKSLGKKLLHIMNNFKIKHLNFNEVIYKNGDIPTSVYFVIKGEVGLQILLQTISPNNHNNLKNPSSNFTAEVIPPSSYFGQQQILINDVRIHTAKALSSQCIVLELDRDIFQKLFQNPEFYHQMRKSSIERSSLRQKKIKMAKSIMFEHYDQPTNQNIQFSQEQLQNLRLTDRSTNKRKISTLRPAEQKLRVMHGNLIRDCRVDNQKINFSMLKVNPDHFESTKDKFRRYNVKEYKYEPKPSWNFKKLWHILNLQDVLRQQDIELSNTEGRKFFDTHRRLQNQLHESKSLRPKTTSSNYRTKMQYIAYLQQFNQ